jgi:hypothetical protein
MDTALRTRAVARLTAAARAKGLADPRAPYRERLRVLRQTEPDAFERAIEHYEQHVLPSLADAEPLPVWIEYGRFLATLTGAGKVTRIDESGRATSWSPDSPAALVSKWTAGVPVGLVLFIPDDAAADVMVLCQPVSPSDAQQATLRLLVERKLS